ncbi:Uncharacterised protein [Bordetella pertussis]|nr:Uncharacterised protein [Bordetella pertussis]CPN27986.1 Uncharacterised protein [Bordetella pertussis]
MVRLTPASRYFFHESSTRARRTMLIGQCEMETRCSPIRARSRPPE